MVHTAQFSHPPFQWERRQRWWCVRATTHRSHKCAPNPRVEVVMRWSQLLLTMLAMLLKLQLLHHLRPIHKRVASARVQAAARASPSLPRACVVPLSTRVAELGAVRRWVRARKQPRVGGACASRLGRTRTCAASKTKLVMRASYPPTMWSCVCACVVETCCAVLIAAAAAASESAPAQPQPQRAQSLRRAACAHRVAAAPPSTPLQHAQLAVRAHRAPSASLEVYHVAANSRVFAPSYILATVQRTSAGER